jgi:AcrR family transcriptional regulator
LPLPDQPEQNDTRTRIIMEAATLFQANGYGSTTMRAIAERVGITVGASYWYFASKEDLLFTYLDTAVSNILDAIRPSLEAATAEEQLRRFVRAHVGEQLRPLNLYGPSLSMNQLAKFLKPDQHERFQGLRREWLDILRQILRNGIAERTFRDLDVTPTAYVLSTMLDSVVVWYKPDGRLGPQEVVALYEDQVLSMVAARAADEGARRKRSALPKTAPTLPGTPMGIGHSGRRATR